MCIRVLRTIIFVKIVTSFELTMDFERNFYREQLHFFTVTGAEKYEKKNNVKANYSDLHDCV